MCTKEDTDVTTTNITAVLDHGNPPLFIVEKMVDKMIKDALN